MTQQVRTLFQPVADADAVIKDKTFALPRAFLLRDFLEILEDAAFEVEHVLDPLPQKEVRRFLAADATGTEHRDALVVKPVAVFFPPRGKFAKALSFRIDRALKRADGHLVIVPGVDDRDIGRADQLIPFRRVDVMPDAGLWIDVGLTHRDDLFLEPHLELGKRRLVAGGFLPFQPLAAGQRPDMGQDSLDPSRGARDGPVDPFAC